MKKLMILGLLISLFAFWGSKNEVNKVYAEETVPNAVGETSATFFEGAYDRCMAYNELINYYEILSKMWYRNE